MILLSLLFTLSLSPLLNFQTLSPEVKIFSLSSFPPLGQFSGKTIAASCGFAGAGHSPSDYTSCTTTIVCNGTPVSKPGTSLCGGSCVPTDTTCTCANGAFNYPTCNNFCTGGSSGDSSPGGGSSCTSCTATDECGVVKTGSRNPITGVCNFAHASSCSVTNACGQTFSGYQCSSGCTAAATSSDINASCVTSFKVNNDQVNPNGSVEFSWTLKNLPSGYTSTCSFVDLTTPTPRPIPGLQNLSPTTDRVRITNIQNSTRFCLVCQFYNVGIPSGQAAAHQWVRVIRIGED